MIKFIKKLNTFLLLSVLMAGFIFCALGFYAPVPKGVVVDGVPIGGMSAEQAVSLLRGHIEEEAKGKSLKIVGRESEYIYTYPEISFKDDLYFIVRNAQKNKTYTSTVTYYLCGLNEIAHAICLNERIEREEPHALFNRDGAPFTYYEGHDGREADVIKLKSDILSSLKGSFRPVEIQYRSVPRSTKPEQLKEERVLLGEFTTYFDSSNLNRAANIRLAASLINGTVIGGGETASFNEIVGERTAERGFLSAKIIENGEYAEGVGGGVCQVSTTLYNAALLSGLKIAEYHPHSLAVGYVAPSRDAMVSGSACDLKITNPGKTPVYIRARTTGGGVNFRVYGKSDGVKYSFESVVTGTIPPPEEFCTLPEEAREGKDGVLSEGYLVAERSGFIKRVKLRSDKYLPTKKLILNSSDPLPAAKY